MPDPVPKVAPKAAPKIAPKIAIVLPPKEGFQPGGVGAIGLLARRLARAGGVVVGAPQAQPFADVPFLPAPLPFWPPLDRNGRYAEGVVRALRSFGPELIEVHNRPALARRLARAFPHTPVGLFLNNDPQGMRAARSPTERTALLDRMLVAASSDWLRRRFLDGVASPRPVHVLPNCLDLAELPPAPPMAERERLILFAGRLVTDKGADAFVSACAAVLPELPGWRAEMIGADRFSAASPETPFVRRLRTAAEAAGVTLLGYRTHAEVMQAMARAAVVAVPSRWPEPFGLAALEAMANGSALVTSRRGGLPEVAGDAALYADPDASPGAPDGLAQALLALARDPDRRAALAAAGLARARRFDLPPTLDALREVRRKSLPP